MWLAKYGEKGPGQTDFEKFVDDSKHSNDRMRRQVQAHYQQAFDVSGNSVCAKLNEELELKLWLEAQVVQGVVG